MRTIVAANPSPMTLDGTRTYLIGHERVVIIDPGPALPEHLAAVAQAIGQNKVVGILLTHAHPDHAEAAQMFAGHFRANVHSWLTDTLHDNESFATDIGPVQALATPGHTRDHFSFACYAERSVCCGDLMMGGLDTALVAWPEGNLRDYFTSLKRLRMLEPQMIYPAHGEVFQNATEAIDRYVAHRQQRVKQVAAALASGPLPIADLIDVVYGAAIDARLRSYAETALRAYLEYLREEAVVHESKTGVWRLN